MGIWPVIPCPGIPTYCGDGEGVLETALGGPRGSTSNGSPLYALRTKVRRLLALTSPVRTKEALCPLTVQIPTSLQAFSSGLGATSCLVAFIGEVDMHNAGHSKSRHLVFIKSNLSEISHLIEMTIRRNV